MTAPAQQLLRLMQPLVRSKPLQAYLQYQAGEEEAALRHWARASELDDDRGVQALRSLAVHHHRQAYAAELEGNRKLALKHWTKAVPLWGRVLQAKTFRDLLPQLSAVQKGVALAPGELDAMVELLCESLLSPHLTLVKEAVDRKEWPIAAAHVNVIRDSGVPGAIIAAALERLTTRICRLTREPIAHTTFEAATAAMQGEAARFAREHLPEHAHGRLELAALEAWKAQKAAEIREDLDGAWKRLTDKDVRALLDELAEARDRERDPVIAHLIRTRLREAADASCRLHFARLLALPEKRDALIARIKAALQRAPSSYDRRKVLELAIGETEELLAEAETGVKFCDELTARFGEGTWRVHMNDAFEPRREVLSRDIEQIQELRLQR